MTWCPYPDRAEKLIGRIRGYKIPDTPYTGGSPNWLEYWQDDEILAHIRHKYTNYDQLCDELNVDHNGKPLSIVCTDCDRHTQHGCKALNDEKAYQRLKRACTNEAHYLWQDWLKRHDLA